MLPLLHSRPFFIKFLAFFFVLQGISNALDQKAILMGLYQKVKSPMEPRGYDFDPIPGPQSKSSKIGIVGAGMSGVHMAYSLKNLGYESVKIFEKTNRISGKTYQMNYRGIGMA